MSESATTGVGVDLTLEARYQLFKQRWPGWQVRITELWPGGESFFWPRKIIQIDISEQDWRVALSHAAAHLQLHLWQVILNGEFTATQEQEADELAEFWMAVYGEDDIQQMLVSDGSSAS